MKLKSKLSLVILLLLIVSLAVFSGISLLAFKSSEIRRIESLKFSDLEGLRKDLKNFVGIAKGVVQSLNSESTALVYQEEVYGRSAKCILIMLEESIKNKIHQIEEKKLTLKEAQALIASEANRVRYNNGEDYIWIQTDQKPFPQMIMHPLRPELNGKVLDSPAFDCARNRAENLFVAAIDVASPSGGFMDYLWEKGLENGTRIPNVPKISYVKPIKEWGWIIGAGVFIDEAVDDSIKRLKTCIQKLQFDEGSGFFWIHDLKGKLVCHGEEETHEGTATVEIPDFIKKGLTIIQSGNKEGFFEFEKIETSKIGSKKHLAFVQVFEPLGWVLGTSKSMDSLEQRVIWENEETDAQIFKFLLGVLISFFGFALVSLRLVNRTLGEYGLLDKNENGDENKSINLKNVLEISPEKLKEEFLTGEKKDLSTSKESELEKTSKENSAILNSRALEQIQILTEIKKSLQDISEKINKQ
ncbi:MAG: cache domain-containing protein [Candidatus Riflebacteria bacterium]|nr:cache domain-containing protein [Candidatus Riflebacteria bacterium]